MGVEEELRTPLRSVQVGRILKQHAGFAQRSDGQTIPAGDHLVVPAGLWPQIARGQQAAADALPPRRVVRLPAQLKRRHTVFEGPGRSDLQQRGGPAAVVLTEHLDELLRSPGVGQALDPLGVGIQSRGEAALERAEVTQEEVRSLARDPFCER